MVSKDENRNQTLLPKKASVKQQLKEAQPPVPSYRPKLGEDVR
jgi:hypothetical protein